MPEKHNNLEYCPGSGQGRVNFAGARRGHGSDPEIILCQHVTAEVGGKGVFPGKKGFLLVK